MIIQITNTSIYQTIVNSEGVVKIFKTAGDNLEDITDKAVKSIANEQERIIFVFIDHISNEVDIDLTLTSGEGEYDNSKSIRFLLDNDDESIPTYIDIYQVHGVALIVGWGFLHILGYCAARYLKHYHWWLYIHVLCTELPAIATIGTIGVIYSRSNINHNNSWL
jgi:hypothetical protein